MTNEALDRLTLEMIDYFQGDAKRIQHLLKVHAFARLIGLQEHLDEETMFTLEAAALIHDIGIKPAEEKYGRTDGRLQEQEGPMAAGAMLQKLNFSPLVINRVCYLVGHHHTYDHINGVDYQILIEADFLVNLFEDGCDKDAARTACAKIFRTESGIHMCIGMFGL